MGRNKLSVISGSMYSTSAPMHISTENTQNESTPRFAPKFVLLAFASAFLVCIIFALVSVASESNEKPWAAGATTTMPVTRLNAQPAPETKAFFWDFLTGSRRRRTQIGGTKTVNGVKIRTRRI